jgi:uncharacterized delta-60 repeat protein
VKNFKILFLLITAFCSLLPALLYSQVDTAWVRRYNGMANGNDYISAATIDDLGNVYETGCSYYNSDLSAEYLTIKYNSAGEKQWVARYHEPGTSFNFAIAIAVDNSGNVYVTGVSEYPGAFATIKYNSAGIEQWHRRYNEPGGNYYNYGNAIAVDNSGNVYVTGASVHQGGEQDAAYATIKYDSAGVQQWVARYSGYVVNQAEAIALDNSGNIYVTGVCADTIINYSVDKKYATIKYNSEGVQQWVARYNGPVNNGEDEAHAIAVDNSGNIYVTGQSQYQRTVYPDFDYATIKYNSEGVQQWVARYNGPANDHGEDYAHAIVVDNSGNVYVTGQSRDTSGSGYDYATIKYDSAGEEQWIARYDGPANGDDKACAMALDDSGNVYVTGSSGVEHIGNDLDYATIEYNSAGEEQWVIRYAGPSHAVDEAKAIAVTSLGNVYVAGWSWGGTPGMKDGNADYTTIKYIRVGNQISVNPGHFSIMIQKNQTKNATLTISNIGSDPLTWTLTEFRSVGWLSEDSTSGTILHGNQINVTITFNDTGLSLGAYQELIVIHSNDSINPTVVVPVQLTVFQGWIQMEPTSSAQAAAGKYVKDGGSLVAVDDSLLYVFRGNRSKEFYQYIPSSNTWIKKASIPWLYKPGTTTPIKKYPSNGAALCYDGDTIIYATKSGGTREFWAYDINQDSWTMKETLPPHKGVKGGTSMVFKADTVYLLAGSMPKPESANFYAYIPATNSWEILNKLPSGPYNKTWKDGSCLTLYNDTIYALKGSDKQGYFYKYDGTNWNLIDAIPKVDTLKRATSTVHLKTTKKIPTDGASMVSGGGKIYIIKGGGSTALWKYAVGSGFSMSTDDTIPRLNAKSYVKTGAALAYADSTVWLLKGNNTPEFWKYVPSDEIVKSPSEIKNGIMAQTTNTIFPFMLYQNMPNPFQSQTVVRYSLPVQGNVSLMIYDISGRQVKTLVDQHQTSGIYSVNWNGENNQGRKVGQGIFFYVLKTDNNKMQKKMLMLR